MTIHQVIETGAGEISGPHGTPRAESGTGTVIAVNIPTRRNANNTEYFELAPAQYQAWGANKEAAIHAANMGWD